MKLFIKRLSGDVFPIVFREQPTGDQIYRKVLERVEEAYEISKLWITHREKWVEPRTDRPVEIDDEEVLDAFVCQAVIGIKIKDGGIRGGLHRFYVRVERSNEPIQQETHSIYFLEWGKGYYPWEEIDDDPEMGYVPYRDCTPRLSLEEFVEKFNLSMCDSEWMHSILFLKFRKWLNERDVWPIYTEDDKECVPER